MTVSPGAAPDFRHGLAQHGRIGLRGRVVGGLDGGEDPIPAVACDEMGDAAPRFSGSDAERDAVLSGKVGDELGRTREERLVPGRIGAQAPERVPVGGGEARDRPVRADQRRERLGQRQADHGQRAGAARRPEAVRREGFALRFDDQMLAVDEGAVDVEHDELHG